MSPVLLQISTLIFIILFAGHDAPACNSFEDYGQQKKQEDRFHAFGLAMRCMWLVVIYRHPDWEILIAHAGIMGLFDAILNVARGRKRWYYLGKTAWFDRLFGSGKVKAAIAVTMIITGNILHYA